MNADTAALNRFWGELIVEECLRCGVDFFCVSPGSRSTPLALAVAGNPRANHLVHFDERGSAFFALGHARATGRPAAWVTTSGTAVANGYPAVIEAASDGVPMLLLTADRPPELRDTGANQTIRQPGIFGGYPRWHCELPAPASEIDPAFVLTTVDQAVHRASRAPAGPVHLNCMFREPLVPAVAGRGGEPGVQHSAGGAELAGWRAAAAPYTRYAAAAGAPPAADVMAAWDALLAARRGVVVAGRLPVGTDTASIVRLARVLGWPLLPDIGSQLRLGTVRDPDPRAPFYDQLLADEGFAAGQAPDAVVHVGGGIVSKRLLEWLAQHQPAVYIVANADPARLDPNHQVTHRFESVPAAFCHALAALAAADDIESAAKGWASAWTDRSARVAARLTEFFEDADALSEPLVARLVSQHIPARHGLVLASSMAIRDMNRFALAAAGGVPVAANRGASGIDGTVATAAGFAAGLGEGATLLIGDLALLHDLNSLALLRERQVVVVLINNDGGGIFSFLPVATQPAFEAFFGTPHGYTFENAAAMFGLPYHQPPTPSTFIETYRGACTSGRSALIEVVTDRTENVELHRRLQGWIVGVG